MSSPYPILDDKPIDQWRVTELKEELKRRKLTTKGLKDDLIKRLDQALRLERDGADGSGSQKDEVNGLDGDIAELNDSHMKTAVGLEVVDTAGKGSAAVVEPMEKENAGMSPEVVHDDSKKSDDVVPVDIDGGVLRAVDQAVRYTDFPAGVDSTNGREELTTHTSTTETTVTVTESVLTEEVVSGQDSVSAEPQSIHDQDSVTMQENEESKAGMDEDSKPQLDCDLKPLCEDLTPNSSLPENQVSEVNPSLGSHLKSDSISSNSVSINQKNELKDTIIADNVKLEEDIVRPEMVEEPSSNNDIPGHDVSHSMDVGEPHKKKTPVEENSYNNKSPNLNKPNSSEDVEYPEKLNLDRSSGDDSMEEDLPESKQYDSKFNVDELRDKGESVEVSILKEEGRTAVVGDGLSPDRGDTHHDNEIPPVSLVEKRKSHDQASAGNNEPAKRQRRWNSETVKGSDQQVPSLRPATTRKDEPIASKGKFSRLDSSTIDDAPKERIVPPSQRAPTCSLRIDRFLRPFTLKAVQELLGKTGNVISFWMDQIKTHCYVTYSSVEEAIETRNAVYNLQWPRNGGHLLVAEYVDPQEVKMKLEPTPAVVIPVSNDLTAHPATPSSKPEPPPLQHSEEPSFPAMLLPPPPPLSKLPPAARERLPPPPPPEKVDRPIVTLDDLFRKTSAAPRIYYLPLSEEQVAAKLAVQGKSIIKQ
ncbi:uncharacterized protein LOC130710293 [Lotus japonicus]|nr:uncharacterized protein LOC130710293 [Lotus japonicus]XP_057415489.1 uncharacterized protein LOC130710293 [Lotus japonicus]